MAIILLWQLQKIRNYNSINFHTIVCHVR